MEHILRCNFLKCRKELGDRALVTTCSHIFCLECAARLGLTGQGHEHRNSCPACASHLTSPDDAVISNLKPSEDYKTSVLSGLSPNIIIECANRALSFWAYQATQEVVYQEHLSKALTEKYSNLNVYLDKRKNDELTQAYKEKNRKLLQTQELYDKLKRKAMLGQIQDAAEDAIDSTLHGSPKDRAQFESGSQSVTGYEDIGSPYGRQHHQTFHEQPRMPGGYQHQHQTTSQDYNSSWPRTTETHSNVPVTPSTHRQRVGESTGIGLSTIPGLVAGTPQTQHDHMNMRPPHAPQVTALSSSLQGNPRFPAVGLSSGLKVSHGGINPDRLANSSTRPRIAQRPSPVSSTFNRRPVSGQSENILGGIRSGFTNL
ncbi:hypothetical protein F5B19DRAFT_495721 [Rostrohypoxylon terebratum]|nr:hypothetical protein F5B19DRAFT_495721 [Rostrohypoxylon terebratum]